MPRRKRKGKKKSPKGQNPEGKVTPFNPALLNLKEFKKRADQHSEPPEKTRSSEAEKEKTAGLDDITGQFDKARGELQGMLDGFAGEMANKILGRAA